MPYLLNLDPDLVIPRDQLEEARDRLEQLQPTALHLDVGDEQELSPILFDPLRRYYLGLAYARLGSAAEAEREAAAIDESAASQPEYGGLFRAWARTIRASVAYGQGARDRVVALVEAETGPIRPELRQHFQMPDIAFARVLEIDALLELGRYREALRWLNYGPQNRTDPGLWIAFKSERSARAHEALGEVDEAIADYQLFVGTWVDADPELQPRVEAAKKRLSELVSARG